MFRKLIKNKKAQNTAEYAILIALVVGAIGGIQIYVDRALKAKVRDAAALMSSQQGTSQTGWTLGNTAQYEPYYLHSDYTVDTVDTDTQTLISNTSEQYILSNRTRASGGFTEYKYTNAQFPEKF